jgi:hypothetical protein
LIGLFAGLCLAAGPSQMERGIDDFMSRVPQRVSEPTAAAGTVVQSVPVVQRTCASAARAEDLKAFFAAEFKKLGLWISPEQEKFKPKIGEQISALDKENLISYTIIMQPSGKLTTVVIAAANVGKPMVNPTNDAVAPVPPGSHSITSYRMEAVTGMTYQTPGTPAEVKQFYRDTLGKLGFKETGELMFVKDQTRVVLMVSPGLAERSVALYIDHPTPELTPPPAVPEKPADKPAPRPKGP